MATGRSACGIWGAWMRIGEGASGNAGEGSATQGVGSVICVRGWCTGGGSVGATTDTVEYFLGRRTGAVVKVMVKSNRTIIP